MSRRGPPGLRIVRKARLQVVTSFGRVAQLGVALFAESGLARIRKLALDS